MGKNKERKDKTGSWRSMVQEMVERNPGERGRNYKEKDGEKIR